MVVYIIANIIAIKIADPYSSIVSPGLKQSKILCPEVYSHGRACTGWTVGKPAGTHGTRL